MLNQPLTFEEMLLVRTAKGTAKPKVSVGAHVLKGLLMHLWLLGDRDTDAGQLAELFGCSHMTVCQALKVLRDQGLIRSKHVGRGAGYQPNRHWINVDAVRKLIEPIPTLHMARQRAETAKRLDRIRGMKAEIPAMCARLEKQLGLRDGAILGAPKPSAEVKGVGFSTAWGSVQGRRTLVRELKVKYNASGKMIAAATGISYCSVQEYIRPRRRFQRKAVKAVAA